MYEPAIHAVTADPRCFPVTNCVDLGYPQTRGVGHCDHPAMDYEPLAAAVVAASGLVGLYFQTRSPNVHAAEEIKRELDILASLPEGSQLRAPLQSRVEESLRRYIAGNTPESRTRDWVGVNTSLVLCAGAVFLAWMATTNGGWWWSGLVLAIPFACVGVISFPAAFVKAERDSRGRRVEPAPADNRSGVADSGSAAA